MKEIRRLASIWVELQVHLFEGVVPEIHRKFQLKDVHQQLRAFDRNIKDAPVSISFKTNVMKLIGSIPDAVDVKRQAERCGRFGPGIG